MNFTEWMEKSDKLIRVMEEDRDHISYCLGGEIACAYQKMMGMAIEEVKEVQCQLRTLEEQSIL